jgi:hypothetical protein
MYEKWGVLIPLSEMEWTSLSSRLKGDFIAADYNFNP